MKILIIIFFSYYISSCFCSHETVKKKRGKFGESEPSFHSLESLREHRDHIYHFGESNVHQFDSSEVSSWNPFYNLNHFHYLQPAWSLNTDSKYHTYENNPSSMIPVAASGDILLPVLQKEIILTSHSLPLQKNHINLFYPEPSYNSKNIYLNANNMLGSISPPQTKEEIDEPPPPPTRMFNAASPPTAKTARGLSLGSGSLGYRHLGNGVFALGSGSLGATGNNAQKR